MEDSLLREAYENYGPFGPATAPGKPDAACPDFLFFSGSLISKAINSRPTIIIGRRGSGKTTFLRSAVFDRQYYYVVELSPHDAFRHVIDSIAEFDDVDTLAVEEIADVWNVLLWHTVLVKLAQSGSESARLDLIREYVGDLDLIRMKNPHNIMRRVLQSVRKKVKTDSAVVLTQALQEFLPSSIPFEAVHDAAEQHLRMEKRRAIILIDSLEDFHLHDPTRVAVLRGLLYCQGQFHSLGSYCELRMCAPSEIYHTLRDLSASPLKDFGRKVLLHWHAAELVQLAARRYSTFLQLFHPSHWAKVNDLNLDERGDAMAFWKRILPDTIKNKLGTRENSLAYILRHTQLQPRHLLLYMNAIAKHNFQREGTATHFTPSAIQAGIAQTEGEITAEVIKAYQYVHPGALDACKRVIPALGFSFKEAALHSAFNKRFKRMHGILSFPDFREMMTEIGALGVVSERTEKYVQGRFEYTVPHRLPVPENAEFCVHPIFSEIYAARKPKGTERQEVVYPYGADVECTEFRDFG